MWLLVYYTAEFWLHVELSVHRHLWLILLYMFGFLKTGKSKDKIRQVIAFVLTWERFLKSREQSVSWTQTVWCLTPKPPTRNTPQVWLPTIATPVYIEAEANGETKRNNATDDFWKRKGQKCLLCLGYLLFICSIFRPLVRCAPAISKSSEQKVGASSCCKVSIAHGQHWVPFKMGRWISQQLDSAWLIYSWDFHHRWLCITSGIAVYRFSVLCPEDHAAGNISRMKATM